MSVFNHQKALIISSALIMLSVISVTVHATDYSQQESPPDGLLVSPIEQQPDWTVVWEPTQTILKSLSNIFRDWPNYVEKNPLGNFDGGVENGQYLGLEQQSTEIDRSM